MRTESPPSTFATVWRVLLKSVATRGRVVGMSVLGFIAVALGIAVHVANPVNRPGASWSLVDSYGLSLLVPVVTLVFASATLGDLAEDGTLVYLWLRPVPRWQLAVGAVVATVTVVVPVAVLPLVVGAALTGDGGRLVAGAAAGALLATLAYSAVFCGLGLRVRRALVWGVAYLLIWEQAVARVSHGAARISLFISTRSVAARLANQSPPRNAVAWTTGVIFPLAVAAIAIFLTARSLDRGEIT
jgi:ABC-2 type transport system permease protein